MSRAYTFGSIAPQEAAVAPTGSRYTDAFNASFANTRSLMAEQRKQQTAAKLGQALGSLSPDATKEDYTRAVAPVLADSPEGAPMLMQMFQSRLAGRAKIASEERQNKQALDRIELSGKIAGDRQDKALAASDKRQQSALDAQDRGAAEREAGADRRSGLQFQVTMARIGASDSKADRAFHYQVEKGVMDLAGKNPAAAKALAQRYGVNIPDQFFDQAAANPEFKNLAGYMAKYDDHDYNVALLKGFQDTGSFQGAVTAAGAPPKKQAKPGAGPKDIQMMDWMQEHGVADSPQDAFAKLQGLRQNTTSGTMSLFKDFVEQMPLRQKPKTADDLGKAWRDFQEQFKGGAGVQQPALPAPAAAAPAQPPAPAAPGLPAILDSAIEMGGARARPPAPGNGSSGPTPGTIVEGFRFKGGNPNDQNAWEPIQ